MSTVNDEVAMKAKVSLGAVYSALKKEDLAEPTLVSAKLFAVRLLGNILIINSSINIKRKEST